MTKEAVQALLEADDKAVATALVTLYERQTDSERAVGGVTIEANGIGFNGRDGEFGSSLAKVVLKGWTLSPKQVSCGRRMVKKYHRQLIEAGVFG